MKYFSATILYLLIAALFLGFLALMLDGKVFYIAAIVVLAGWFAIFNNLHRVVLGLLGAREIIDTDYQELFQIIKSNVFTSGAKVPRVYSYSGSYKNCFTLEARGEWAIVIDKNLLKEESRESLLVLVEFLFSYHKSGIGHTRTKILGTLVLYYKTISSFLTKVLRLPEHSRAFQTILTFFILLVRPATAFFENVLKRDSGIEINDGLRALSMQTLEYKPSDVFFAFHTKGPKRINSLIVRYIECFPILKYREMR